MKVSIGVVALNEEKTLPSLFEDFKLQTYPHNEIEIDVYKRQFYSQVLIQVFIRLVRKKNVC